jgi:hypothetical protein
VRVFINVATKLALWKASGLEGLSYRLGGRVFINVATMPALWEASGLEGLSYRWDSVGKG